MLKPFFIYYSLFILLKPLSFRYKFNIQGSLVNRRLWKNEGFINWVCFDISFGALKQGLYNFKLGEIIKENTS